MSDTCQMLFEDIDDSNRVFFKLNESDDFTEFPYCYECLQSLLEDQWKVYISTLKTMDCEKALKKMIELGPPVKFRDSVITKNKYVCEFKHGDQIISPDLLNAPDVKIISSFAEDLNKEILPILELNSTMLIDTDRIDFVCKLKELFDRYNF